MILFITNVVLNRNCKILIKVDAIANIWIHKENITKLLCICLLIKLIGLMRHFSINEMVAFIQQMQKV